MIRLSSLQRSFHGLIPSVIITCAKDGTPNVTYLSQVYYVDEKHVALSCQFFNKTRQNVTENPYAEAHVYDPVTFELHVLQLRFDHAETSGPLFDAMSIRIDAIASHTGMAGVFRLLSADVYEVESIEEKKDFVAPADAEELATAILEMPPSHSELRALRMVCERVSRAPDLDGLLVSLLAVLEEALGFTHSMVFFVDEVTSRLYSIASRGYGDVGIGAEVGMGEGLIGTVARERRILRLSAVDAEMRYGRAVRKAAHAEGTTPIAREIPLPGLPDAQSHLAIPLVARGRLLGVLAVESKSLVGFSNWHETFLDIVGAQAATAIDGMLLRDDGSDFPAAPPHDAESPSVVEPSRRARTFAFYKNDDCVFVDGEYLIRNVPGRIFWKLLRSHVDEGRTSFSNRELRLDPSLGLPAVKDNLESRLILLRKRLAQKCPDVRMVPSTRGHFRLEVESRLTLVEKNSA